MEDEDSAQSIEGIFIVRQGEAGHATYAVCHRVDSIAGNDQITGTNKTAQQLVDEQKLDAAFVAPGKDGPLQSFTVSTATGLDTHIHIRPR